MHCGFVFVNKTLNYKGVKLIKVQTRLHATQRTNKAQLSNNNLQYDLNMLSMWLKINLLMLNVKKTKSMLILKSGFLSVNLNIDGQLIQSVKCIKFLGFYIDYNLSFEHYMHNLYLSLLDSCFIIRRMLIFLPQMCLRLPAAEASYSHYLFQKL